MKSLILWTLVVAFMALAMAAVNMQEWAIAAVMGVISLGCMLATPSKDDASVF